MLFLRLYLKIAAWIGLVVSPIYAGECMLDQQEFGPCIADPAFTDYETVNLDTWRSQWKMHDLTKGKVPSLTTFCAKGTSEGCQRGSINVNRQDGKPSRIVIDSDVANEVDDYLAIAWALLSSVGPSKQVQVESIIAAPFSFGTDFCLCSGHRSSFSRTGSLATETLHR
jgi:hypothetical protein